MDTRNLVVPVSFAASTALRELLRLLDGAAIFAPLRGSEIFIRIKTLLTRRKGELRFAVDAVERFILER